MVIKEEALRKRSDDGMEYGMYGDGRMRPNGQRQRLVLMGGSKGNKRGQKGKVKNKLTRTFNERFWNFGNEKQRKDELRKLKRWRGKGRGNKKIWIF